MRKTILLTALTALLLLSSCASEPASLPQGRMHTEFSKEHVEEFLSVYGTGVWDGLLYGMEYNAETCFNVTPEAIARATDVEIFKFGNSCVSAALIDGAVYPICRDFGGYGFFNAVPWDYDADGTTDLLIASSWGSGVHRSELSVFNVKTKESILICSSLDLDAREEGDGGSDWFVAAQTPSAADRSEAPVSYAVYSGAVEVGDHLADLSYTAKALVGSVVSEDGGPVFHPARH